MDTFSRLRHRTIRKWSESKKIDYDVMRCRRGWGKLTEENSENINDFRWTWDGSGRVVNHEKWRRWQKCFKCLKITTRMTEKRKTLAPRNPRRVQKYTKLLNYFSWCVPATLRAKYCRSDLMSEIMWTLKYICIFNNIVNFQNKIMLPCLSRIMMWWRQWARTTKTSHYQGYILSP